MSAHSQFAGITAVRRSDAEPNSAWDGFVARCPGGDLVQTTAWATSKRAIGLHTSLTTLHGPDSVIVGGGLVIAKQSLAGVRLGYVSRGPLVDTNAATTEQVVDALISSAQLMGVRLMVVQAPLGGEAVDLALVARGFELGCPAVAPEATIRLDLTRRDDELLADMSEMRRRNIRKVLRSRLAVEQDDDVELFQRLHASTAARQGFTPIELSTLRSQWDTLAPAGLCTMFIARHAGNAVAGLWLTSFAGVVTFKLAGWDADVEGGRNANEALHWAAMRWARSSGATTYDLGGFDRRAAELIAATEALPEGFAKTPAFFKLGFGGSLMVLPKARWSLIGASRRFLQAPARWVLTSGWVHGIVNRLRNG